MSAPRQFAGYVCLFCVFSAFQGVMWHWRPEPGWHPSWWQLHTLAWFGFYICLPLNLFPVVILRIWGVTSGAVLWPALVFGVLFGFAVVYLLAFGFAKVISRSLHGFKKHTTVA
jgi:hypothetical protein